MDEKLSSSELRKFGLILAGGFVLFFGLLFPLLKGRGVHLTSWPWLLAGILVLVSLAAPKALGPLNKAWLFLGHILGWINTRIILGLIFLVIFTPAALVYRFLGNDPLQRSLDPKQNSYRTNSKQPNPKNFPRPY
ncbi:SxtJ family membrane protein [Candidatus Electronema sp. PJ]|uniref:SxtJ family membrane protein n=1 Tax=Candidatus Electronema sp. PJ TaxID=3401572 RepID=UPI003AA8BA6A